MRERVGFIAGINGVVLPLRPNFNPGQMAMYFSCLVRNYWPAILIIIGLLLVNLREKKTKGKNRQAPLDKNGAFYIIKE